MAQDCLSGPTAFMAVAVTTAFRGDDGDDAEVGGDGVDQVSDDSVGQWNS